MTNRSYVYTRLQNYSTDFPAESSSNGKNTRSFAKEKQKNQQASSSDEEIEFSPMKLRRLKSGISLAPALELRRDFIDHSIRPGETLQGIALQYRCSVFDLKRVNNIVNDTEFFAFRILKVPVTLHSSLTEATSPTVGQEREVSPSKVRSNLVNAPDFLQQVDQDLEKLKEKTRSYEVQAEVKPEVYSHAEASQRQRPKKMDCRGDDCGMSWTQVVGLAFLVLLACPLLYFLHLELEKHNKETSSSSVTVNRSHVS